MARPSVGIRPCRLSCLSGGAIIQDQIPLMTSPHCTCLAALSLLALLAPPALARQMRASAPHPGLDRALAAARAVHDTGAEAQAHRDLGTFLYKQARYADARTEFLAALQLYEARGDHAGAGWTLHSVGLVAYVHESGEAATQCGSC